MSDGGQPVEERRPDWAALGIAAVLGLLSIIVAWNTSTIGGAASYAQIGPATFPYVIAACLFILAICTAFVAWRGGFPAREEQNLPPMLWITGGFVAQMLLLHSLGFSIATGLLFGATAKGFGRGPLWFTVPLGVVLALAIWIVFAKGLQLSLPAGPIERLF